MNCMHCGAVLEDGSRFCANCGKSVPAPAAPAAGGFMRAGGLGGDLNSRSAAVPAKPASSAPIHSAPPVSPPPPRPAAAVVETPPKPVKPAPTPSSVPHANRRISAKRELKLLMRQGWLVMLGEKRNLIISLFFPLLAGFVSVWITGEKMFIDHESTKFASFILVCAAIWCGLFNSIQSIVKERENIKRDYVSGALRIGCYTASRAILQAILCLVQSTVLCLAIPCVKLVHGNEMPSEGVLGIPVMIEYFVSLFLVMYAADAMGLMISAIVKKDEMASKMAPYILIVQLLFSGVMFEMKGIAKGLSALMLSRWGMESMGSVSNLNSFPPRIHTEVPGTAGIVPFYDEAAFDNDPGHLLLAWGVLLLFVAVQLTVCAAFLKKVKNDTRE